MIAMVASGFSSFSAAAQTENETFVALFSKPQQQLGGQLTSVCRRDPHFLSRSNMLATEAIRRRCRVVAEQTCGKTNCKKLLQLQNGPQFVSQGVFHVLPSCRLILTSFYFLFSFSFSFSSSSVRPGTQLVSQINTCAAS